MAASFASLVFLLSLSLSAAPLQSLARPMPRPPAPRDGGEWWDEPRLVHGPAVAPVRGPAMAPAPAQARPGWGLIGAVALPKPLMRACVQTPFPAECARAISPRVDPRRAADVRRLTEVSMRVAIEAGTALAAFGYVHIGGARNGTRMRQCVRDCTVRVDAAVRSMNASAAAMKRGAHDEALQLLGGAANGMGACWGSCARFTGEAMHVMQRRARQLEKLIKIASAILNLLIIGAILL
ncbi:hypothetical protein ACP70R_025777 [Stipagrostis hirtigluma subsp. patula]